ncbi:hypothetical protein Tco_0893715 [Tanacetum coccineum]|uniref:Uncharacterized protein n=1 Tax=Tanacetum coccineum TaxID=301880 RepID=A0ABQ5CCG4_9ASTR
MSAFLSCFYLKPKEHQVIVEEQSPREIKEVENKEVVQEHEPVSTPQKKIEEVPPLIVIDDNDCQDSNETTTKAADLEDKVSQLPLTIIQPDKMYLDEIDNEKTSSLEIAVVTSPNDTSVTNSISRRKPGGAPGGFDKMLLYSLYEDDIAKKQIQWNHPRGQHAHGHDATAAAAATTTAVYDEPNATTTIYDGPNATTIPATTV